MRVLFGEIMYLYDIDFDKPKMEYHFFLDKRHKSKFKKEALNYYIVPLNSMIHVMFDELSFAYHEDKIKLMSQMIKLREKIARVYHLKKKSEYKKYRIPDEIASPYMRKKPEHKPWNEKDNRPGQKKHPVLVMAKKK